MERPQKKSMRALHHALTKRLGNGLDRPAPTAGRGSQMAAQDAVSTALDQSIERALACAARVQVERNDAPLRLEELLSLPAAEREAAVSREAGYQSYQLASHLLKRSEKAVFHDLGLARELARLAHLVALHTEPQSCGGSEALADLQAYALGVEGNALRVAGELREALVAFMRAREAQEQGGADPDLSARLDLMEASLRRDLRQLDKALELLDRAARTFISLRDAEQTARAMINRANVFLVKRDLDHAIGSLRAALPLVKDSWLELHLRHNLISALAECGKATDAAEIYEETRGLYLQFSDPLTNNRRCWAEGLIARELGELEKARLLLVGAAENLAANGYGFDAVLAGLDLVAVHAKQGNAEEVLRVASHLLQVFQLHNVRPEALVALCMVQEAAERRELNRGILAQAAEILRANQARTSRTD